MKQDSHHPTLFLAVAAGLAVGLFAGTAGAKVTGVCSNCHTMHNSQNDAAPNWPNGTADDGNPDNFLLRGGCLGCHSAATNNIEATSGAPVVYRDTTEPTKTLTSGSTTIYLAGGDFYWMKNTGDQYGHNVADIKSGQDGNMPSFDPPGWSNNASFTAADGTQVASGAASWGTNQLTCDGVYGCHGTHTSAGINGGHHGDDSTIDGTTVAKSYRFLIGIKGAEDSDWEKTFGSADHNSYFGERRTSGTVNLDETISFLCAQCHGNFHSSDGDSTGIDGGSSFASAWVRHPVDIDLDDATGTEYGSYTTYDPVVPVATTTVATTKSDISATGDAIVTCVSCHRAHGSPYADLLRWDYSTCDAGSGTGDPAGAVTDPETECGCFRCHSTKDDA